MRSLPGVVARKLAQPLAISYDAYGIQGTRVVLKRPVFQVFAVLLLLHNLLLDSGFDIERA